MTTLFISDLHLDGSRPETTDAFLKLLREDARRAQALYILGDFFEAWIGDDDDDAHSALVIAALRGATRSGLPIHLMHGNRDFLIGQGFVDKTGVELLPEPTVLDLYGVPTLLVHGDALCTDDAEYQMVRRMLRDPAWQREYLAKPIAERRAIAAAARAQSKAHTATQAEYIMDVNQKAVAALMAQHGVTRLIHGHTHRPGVHRFTSPDGKPLERIVLGDWYEQSSKLTWDKNGGMLSDRRVSDGKAD